MQRVIMGVLFFLVVIVGCGTTTPAKPTQALPNDIPDMETQRRIEEERRASHEQQHTNGDEADDGLEDRAALLEKNNAALRAAEEVEHAALLASLPPSPEGMHTWILESLDMASCDVEGVSLSCIDARVEARGPFDMLRCSDEDADRIAVWFQYSGERRGFSRAIDKPFLVPADIKKPSEALNYLLKLIHHNGAYERPSVEALRERLIESFAALEIPNIYDDSIDAARWRQVLQPLFWENLPKDPKDWGMPATTNEAFLTFQRDVRTRGDISVSIVFQSWGRESSDYFVCLQNERGVEAAAHIDRWSSDVKRCRVANGTIIEIDWDFYRSDQDGGGR